MKMTKTMTAAALAVAMITAPAALAKNGKQKNKAKHGQHDSQIAQGFARFDANGDGLISRSEFPADPLLFDRLDANRDNVLSQSEARQFANSGDLEREARRLDLNRDGMVSRDEWRGDWNTFDQLDRNDDGVISQADRARNGRVRTDSGNRFRGMDRNSDGRITRSEWRGNDTSFRNQDRNRDGVLSGSELRGGK
jgi:Ca2+-binding EF-hand superfamily protein